MVATRVDPAAARLEPAVLDQVRAGSRRRSGWRWIGRRRLRYGRAACREETGENLSPAIDGRRQAEFEHIVRAHVIDAHRSAICLPADYARSRKHERQMPCTALTRAAQAIEVIELGVIVLRLVRGDGNRRIAHVVILLQPRQQLPKSLIIPRACLLVETLPTGI